MNLTGRWRIVAMDRWDRETIDLNGPAVIEFHTDRRGVFRFVAVEGWMDCRVALRDGRPRVDFTWEGHDEGDLVNGRGWAAIDGEGRLHGHIYFHLGDDSGFVAVPTEDDAALRLERA